jgi:hypothetical protein
MLFSELHNVEPSILSTEQLVVLVQLIKCLYILLITLYFRKLNKHDRLMFKHSSFSKDLHQIYFIP